VSCDLAWARDDDYFRARQEWGCGAVLSIGIHAFDAVCWATGRAIDSVASITLCERSLGDGEDAAETGAVAIFRLSGGAAASFRISLDGGGNSTRITVCGGGITVQLAGGEADPTGGVLEWSAPSAHDRGRLQALERDTPGALGSPLLVPYLGTAISALRDGERPGQSQRLPSISDVSSVHAAAMTTAAGERVTPSACKSPDRTSDR
jgi:predicted dehydrogenase